MLHGDDAKLMSVPSGNGIAGGGSGTFTSLGHQGVADQEPGSSPDPQTRSEVEYRTRLVTQLLD